MGSGLLWFCVGAAGYASLAFGVTGLMSSRLRREREDRERRELNRTAVEFALRELRKDLREKEVRRGVA